MQRNNEELLIDFNYLNVDDQPSSVERIKEDVVKSVSTDENNESSNGKLETMAFLCSSQPLYKLLCSESNDMGDNNPFDHLDKQACLSDDPFEIVENAALISFDAADHIEKNVETGMLISIESPVIVENESGSNNIHCQTLCDTPKKACSTNEIQRQDSVQNASQKQPINSKSVSPKSLSTPSGKNRCKTKNTSLNLLKYSLSNSRLDLVTEAGGMHNDENAPIEEKPKMGTPVRRRSTGGSASTDDSFDDIWCTKPNLIDSQTDIDIESDIENDIAKLNIPMLNISVNESNSEENPPSKVEGQVDEKSTETKAANRSEMLEKFASIKQKIPKSPGVVDTAAVPIHNQTVDVKHSQLDRDMVDEPITPKSQYSSVLLPEKMQSDNRNSLIENLKKLVDQYDDKSNQTTTKTLLDDLSSILTTERNQNNDRKNNDRMEERPPQLIKRQGTFSIEKDNDIGTDAKDQCSKNTEEIEQKTSPINPGLSEVVKQIQNVLGVHQNINVVQSNVQTVDSMPIVNPTYIVVMAQPVSEVGEKEECQRPRRSQSLTMKEKPLAAIRATQHKAEQSRVLPPTMTTPIKRPVLQRRGSFSTITRTTPNNESEQKNRPSVPPAKPDASKVIRRRSLQGPTSTNDPKPTTQVLNPVTRRRSFQPTASSAIRSPSPKANPNTLRGQPVPLRLNCNTTGTLTRRKSFAHDTAKDSPQKVKSSYGIMKKPPAPPTARNLKIRVSQTVYSGRSTAPLRAVMPMNRVASLLLISETVSAVEDNKSTALITSTPRSIPVSSPLKYKNGIYFELQYIAIKSHHDINVLII